MRDKVKRFLSILMTALMLVNLLPVGALAEGFKISNSVQGIWEKPPANVYVYVQVTGDTTGLTINPSGWYTIGKSTNVPKMGIPSFRGPRSFRQVGVWPDTVLDKSRFTRWTDNQKIDLGQITWTEFYIDNGADNYVKAGTLTWHMNGTIDIKQLPSVYTIKYVDYDTKELIHSYEESGLMGQTPKKITAPDSWQENLYSFYFVNGHPKEQTVDFKKDKGELTFYYKKNTANYTVNYYLNGTTTKVAAPKKGTAALGSSVTESPITVDGYTPVSGDSKKITIKANSDENVINFYYYKNVELTANSDTATYDGNEHSVSGFTGKTVKEEKTVTLSFDSVNVPEVTRKDAGTDTVAFNENPVGKVDTTEKYIVTKATDGQLVISKRPVTLTSASDKKVYDGNALTNDKVTVSGDGFVEGEGATYKVTGTQTNVGKSKNTFTYELNGNTKAINYTITTAEGELEVTAVTDEVVVTITGHNSTVTYNGSEQSVNGYDVSIAPEGVSYTTADFSFNGTAEAKGTDANTYPMNLEAGQFSNTNTNFSKVTFKVTDGSLTITPRAVKLTSETASKPYDGTALTKPVVKIEGSFVEGEVSDVKATGSVTYVSEGEVTNTITFTKGENFKADNYTIEKDEGKLSITPNTDEVTVTITGHNDTKPYNGSKQSVTGYDVDINNKLYKESDFKFSGNAEAKGTDANTYPMNLEAGQFSNTNTNFSKVTFKVTDGSLTITPRAVKLTSETASKPYDGTPLMKPNVTVSTGENDGFVAGEVTDIKATGSVKDVSEGEVTNTITFKTSDKFNADNYTIIKDEGTLSITPRPVTLTSGSAERVYNGEALTKNEVTASTGENEGFVKGEGATYDVTGSQTDVGTSDNTFTYTLNKGTKADNYSIELVFGKLEVTPVTDEVIVTITGRTGEMPYDGKEHSVEGYTVSINNSLYKETDFTFTGSKKAEGTNAGEYKMGLTEGQFTNKSKNFSKVTFVVTDGYVKITPRAVTLTSETAGKTYDGTALEKPVVTVGGDGFVEGQVKEIKATGSVTNAGSVANTITFTPNKETFKEGNYAITKTEGTLTIAKRSVLITSQSATKTYDGSALTRPAVTITGDGFVPGELAKAEATGSITKVGSTPNAIQYTTTGAFNAANYSIALSVGTLTVTEKPKPEPRRTFNLTISYVYQNGKRAAASYNRGGLKNGETFDITSPVIAGYTASETVVSGTIYNRDIKVTVIYTADGVNLDDYGVPLGLGNITMNVGDCFE